MFVLTHTIVEDNLTLADGGLHTFSGNMEVTFFELYYCANSIQKRGLTKQKLEIAASHHPRRNTSKLFSSHHGLKKCLKVLLRG